MGIFVLPSIRRALLASLLVGILLPLVGTYAVMRKNAFLGAGVAHIAFAGVALGFLLHSSPLLFATIFAVLGTLFLWNGKRKGLLEEDVGIGILFAVALALAILFLGRAKAYGTEALAYLFGNILTVSQGDLWLLLSIMVVSFVYILSFWKELFFITFSDELARASQIPVDYLAFVLLLITSLVIVFSLKAVGALLVFGLLVAPSAAALQLSFRMDVVVFLAIIFGVISSLLGLLVSVNFDLPSSSSAVIISFLILFLAFYFSPKKK